MSFTTVDFAFQFTVNSNSIFNVSILQNHRFAKSEYTEIREMKTKPLCLKPSEHYQKILDDFTQPVLRCLNNLKRLVDNLEIEEDFKPINREESLTKRKNEILKIRDVEVFVPLAINMCIKNINHMNRVKFERMITIIKLGINSSCSKEIIEALVQLEYVTRIYYPEDRTHFHETEVSKYRNSLVDLICMEPKSMIKMLDSVKLESSISPQVREILVKMLSGDKTKILKVIIDYLSKIGKYESLLNSTVSINETFNQLNKKQFELSGDETKKIEFSNIVISLTVVNDEMYVDYFGFIERPVGGSFSVDFYRFRNFINDNLTHYVFYLVTCHYCMMNRDNILNVDLNVIPSELHNMFIFFESIYVNKILEKVEQIQDKICYMKIFSNLHKFFYEIMGRPRPETRKTVSTAVVSVPKSVVDNAIANGEEKITIKHGNKEVSVVIPKRRLEKLELKSK